MDGKIEERKNVSLLMYLEELDVSCCNDLTDEGLHHLSNIKHFKISLCRLLIYEQMKVSIRPYLLNSNERKETRSRYKRTCSRIDYGNDRRNRRIRRDGQDLP